MLSKVSNEVAESVMVNQSLVVSIAGEPLIELVLYVGELDVVAWCPFPLLSAQYFTLSPLFWGGPFAPKEVPLSMVVRSVASNHNLSDGISLGLLNFEPLDTKGA